MSQALHIFRKDLRSMRWEIAAVLVLVAAYTFIVRAPGGIFPEWVLPLAWIYLVVRAILEEPLPGDRQFWITRPYNRGSLIAAKALFALTLINLPVLISDCVILAAHGFSPVSYTAGILWRQATLAVVVLLPAAALAAVTRHLGQVLLALIGAAVIFGISLQHQSWGAMEWVRYLPVVLLWIAAASVVLLWQYANRRTTPSRLLLTAAVALTPAVYAAVPWSAAFAVHARMLPESGSSPITVRLDPTRKVVVGRPMEDRARARASVPIEIAGLRDDQDFQADTVSVELESQGEKWRYNWTDAMAISCGSGDNYWADIYVSGPWRAERRANVKLRLSIALTVFARNAPVTVFPGESWSAVPNFGACRFGYDPFARRSIECVWPLRPPPRTVTYAGARPGFSEVRIRPLIPLASYAPYPAAFRTNPLMGGGFEGRMPWVEGLRFVTERPVAHVIREVDVPDVSLTE